MKVMMADTDPTNMRLVKSYLSDVPCDTLFVSSGSQLVRQVGCEDPEVIILGDTLEDMPGIDACRTLKGDDSTREFQVLMVTSQLNHGDVERMVQAGVDDIIVLPSSKDELHKRLKALARVFNLNRQVQRLLDGFSSR